MLVELTHTEGSQHGALVASQMLDVTVRVLAVRHFAVAQMALLLENVHVLASAAHHNTMLEVRVAAAACRAASESAEAAVAVALWTRSGAAASRRSRTVLLPVDTTVSVGVE